MVRDARLIALHNAAAWDAALAGMPAHFVLSRAYNEAMAAASGDETFLLVMDQQDARVVCPLSLRYVDGKADAVSPYGFGGFALRGEWPGFSEAFQEFMAKENIVAGYIVQHPLIEACALTHPEERFKGKQCFLMDIAPPPEQLLANMASDHRSRLRQWLKQEPALSQDKTRLLAPFLTLYPQAMQRAGATASYDFGERALSLLSQSQHALLVGAGQGDAVEAVSLFLYRGEYAEYYLNGCTEEGKRHARGLVWEAARILREKGVNTLNLGCGVREGDALEEFKQRFGGKPRRFSIFKQIYREQDYAALCEARGANAASREGFFPAYRAPAVFDKPVQSA